MPSQCKTRLVISNCQSCPRICPRHLHIGGIRCCYVSSFPTGMLNVEHVDGLVGKSCVSGILQEGSLSSRETQQNWKEPSSTRSWRRAGVALASLWSVVTSQMSFCRSKVWCWTGLQPWMARWRQVQYTTIIHRGLCFHSATHTYCSSGPTLHPSSSCTIYRSNSSVTSYAPLYWSVSKSARARGHPTVNSESA